MDADAGHYAIREEADGEGFLIDDGVTRIPPAQYEGVYVGYETRLYMGRTPKLAVYFKILTPGPGEGATLVRNYNVTALVGPARKAGGFRVGGRSDYYREYCLVAGKPERADRLSPVAFKGKVIALDVRDVEVDGDGRSITKDARYSVVGRILGEV